MRFYRRNWYYIGGILFVALSFIMGFGGQYMGRIRVILIYSFMALLIHQLEEYVFSGGFPAIFNIVLSGERQVPERYPMNTNQCVITNVFLFYPFYLLAILFPDVIWLGMAQVCFGMLQFLAHGILVNIRLKSIYNPGLAAVLFLHIPIGIYYIRYVAENGLLTTGSAVLGVLAAVLFSGISAGVPILLLRDKTSPYAFTKEKMEGYAKEKIAAIRNS